EAPQLPRLRLPRPAGPGKTMASQDHPHAIFRRSIDAGNVVAAELAALALRGLLGRAFAYLPLQAVVVEGGSGPHLGRELVGRGVGHVPTPNRIRPTTTFHTSPRCGLRPEKRHRRRGSLGTHPWPQILRSFGGLEA